MRGMFWKGGIPRALPLDPARTSPLTRVRAAAQGGGGASVGRLGFGSWLREEKGGKFDASGCGV